MPGGKLEAGETLAQAVAREVREETGLVVEVGPLACVVERIGDDYHFVILDYLARVIGGALAAASDVARRAGSSTMPSSRELPLTEVSSTCLARARATHAAWYHLPLAPLTAPQRPPRRRPRRAVERLALAARPHADHGRRARARGRRCRPRSAPGSRRRAQLFRVGITPYYASLMDPVHASCPIRLQAIPRALEADIRDEELRDPLGEDTHNPAPSIVHKYPDRVLFLVVDRCGIYCRHCNRRRLVGGDEPPTTAELEAGLEYIANTPRIRDVLLSGGDPLLLSTRRLDYLLGRLRAIPHVETIRIGTRLPVVCPMRIDAELTAALRKHHPLFINTHFNHVKELTPEARAGCERLVDAGIPVGNQTVLLRGVNSIGAESLRALMRGLLRVARAAVLPVPGRHRDRHRSPAHARSRPRWSSTRGCAAG